MGIFFKPLSGNIIIPANSITLDDPINGKWVVDMIIPGPQAPKFGTVGFVGIDDLGLIGIVTNSTNLGANKYKIRVLPSVPEGIDTTTKIERFSVQILNQPILKVINEILLNTDDECDETTPTNLVNTIVKSYQILNDESPYIQLNKLLSKYPNTHWRHHKFTGLVTIYDNDGTVNTTFPSKYVLSNVSFNGNKTYKCIKLDKYPEPGTVHPDGWTIRQTTIHKDNTGTTIILYKNSINELLNTVSKDNSKYFNQNYIVEVLSQNSDGTLTIKCNDDLKLFGDSISNVPIETIPGLAVQVLPGTLCTLSFHSGDPSFPYISGFSEQSGTYAHVLGNNNNAQFVALADKVLTELEKIRNWANTHKHTGVTTGTGTSAITDTPLSAISSVACSKLKVE